MHRVAQPRLLTGFVIFETCTKVHVRLAFRSIGLHTLALRQVTVLVTPVVGPSRRHGLSLHVLHGDIQSVDGPIEIMNPKIRVVAVGCLDIRVPHQPLDVSRWYSSLDQTCAEGGTKTVEVHGTPRVVLERDVCPLAISLEGMNRRDILEDTV